MPVFWYDSIYLGLASMFHEGDLSAANFDTVDLELTLGTTAERFDRIATDQYLIPRGDGHYPNGDFDCGCIFAAPPLEMDNRLVFYYMGGNGQHTNFRETSFARAFLPKDRFACYEPRDSRREAIILLLYPYQYTTLNKHKSTFSYFFIIQTSRIVKHM